MSEWDSQGDDTDKAQAQEHRINEMQIAVHKRMAGEFVRGEPGECDWCGGYFARLVNGACGRCRDEYKIK